LACLFLFLRRSLLQVKQVCRARSFRGTTPVSKCLRNSQCIPDWLVFLLFLILLAFELNQKGWSGIFGMTDIFQQNFSCYLNIAFWSKYNFVNSSLKKYIQNQPLLLILLTYCNQIYWLKSKQISFLVSFRVLIPAQRMGSGRILEFMLQPLDLGHPV